MVAKKSKTVSAPSNGDPYSYVTIIQGIGGWNSCLMSWDVECGCYTPWQTGVTNTLGHGTKEEAIAEAKHWADS